MHPHILSAIALLLLTLPAAKAADGLGMMVDGKLHDCPLQRTDVVVTISASVARVDITQTFKNPITQIAEAVYTYPLSHGGAIDRFSMQVGERTIRGMVTTREQAQSTYDEAIDNGQIAAVLHQKRPNIFRQQIGNIPPGEVITVKVGYTEVLQPALGIWRFQLPVVVGPRYLPEQHMAEAENNPNPARFLKQGQDSGHRLNLQLNLRTPVSHHHVEFPSYTDQATITKHDAAHTSIKLSGVTPNRDIVCRWQTTDENFRTGVMFDRPDATQEGIVAVHIEPGKWVEQIAHAVPTDWCVLVDCSGSMRGAPRSQAIAAVDALCRKMLEHDRLQLTTFSSSASSCFDELVPATKANREAAFRFAKSQKANGGTNMMHGLSASLLNTASDKRRRVVVLLSDGFIGNETRILELVANSSKDRTFFVGLGIGNSVNRHLFEEIARLGNGLCRSLLLNEDAGTQLLDLLPRLSAPQLKSIEIDWGGMQISDLAQPLPNSIWPGQAITCLARFTGQGTDKIKVTVEGAEGEIMAHSFDVAYPDQTKAVLGLGSAWAKSRIQHLQRRMIKVPAEKAALQERITKLAIRYQITSQYTSFIAIDEALLPEAERQQLHRLDVAVPLPAGTSMDGIHKARSQDIRVPMPAKGGMGGEMGGPGVFMAIGASGGASGTFGNRTGGGRKRAVGKFGGSKASESAAEAGLRFLYRHQSPDGRWDVDKAPVYCLEMGPRIAPGTVRTKLDGDLYLTAECLLAMTGGGYNHRNPNRYQMVLKKGIAFIQSQQQADGRFGTQLDTHAKNTQILAEAYGMTNDPNLRLPAQNAVTYLLGQRHQIQKQWGWGEQGHIDMVTSLYAIEALRAAKNAGLDVQDGMDRMQALLDYLHSRSPTSAHLPQGISTDGQLRTGTARSDCAAWHVAILASLKKDDDCYKRLQSNCTPPAKGPDSSGLPTAQAVLADPECLAWRHYCMLFHGGDSWKAWNSPIRDAMIATQAKAPDCPSGSFTVPEGTTAKTLHNMGPPAIATQAIRVLQVYYRHPRVKP